MHSSTCASMEKCGSSLVAVHQLRQQHRAPTQFLYQTPNASEHSLTMQVFRACIGCTVHRCATPSCGSMVWMTVDERWA